MVGLWGEKLCVNVSSAVVEGTLPAQVRKAARRASRRADAYVIGVA